MSSLGLPLTPVRLPPAAMSVPQLQLLGVSELLGGGARGASPPLMVLPPRVLNLPHISGAPHVAAALLLLAQLYILSCSKDPEGQAPLLAVCCCAFLGHAHCCQTTQLSDDPALLRNRPLTATVSTAQTLRSLGGRRRPAVCWCSWAPALQCAASLWTLRSASVRALPRTSQESSDSGGAHSSRLGLAAMTMTKNNQAQQS